MSKCFSDNPLKKCFLDSLPKSSIADSDITQRCKFNFSYFTTQNGSQSFQDWNKCPGDSKLAKLIDKLKEYTRQPLSYWKNQAIGKGKRAGKGPRHNCLEIYGEFPKKSAFKHPPHVPEDVLWGRFRVDSDSRLAGFVIPQDYYGHKGKNGELYDTNTFYIVFLDEKHDFFQTK